MMFPAGARPEATLSTADSASAAAHTLLQCSRCGLPARDDSKSMNVSPWGAAGWACIQLPCQFPYCHHDLPGCPCQMLVTPHRLQRLPAGRQKASLPLLWRLALDSAGEDPQEYQRQDLWTTADHTRPCSCWCHSALAIARWAPEDPTAPGVATGTERCR